MMRRVRSICCALGVLSTSGAFGCVSYYSDGAKFQPVAQAPEGMGLVYVYRPARAWGAAYVFHVVWQSRHFDLVAGSYAAFLLPEGKQTLEGSQSLTVDVKKAQPVYAKIEFDSQESPAKVMLIPEAEAKDEIASIHLGAGGLARWPIPPMPGTSPTKTK